MKIIKRTQIGLFLAVSIFISLGMTLFPMQADAEDATRSIMVLPFEINAADEYSYLRKDLPVLLREELQKMGFQVLPAEETSDLLRQQNIEVLNLDTVKNLAIMADTEYAVYGSLTQVGEDLSLDVRLVEPYQIKGSRAIYITKKGLINILPAVEELAEKIKNILLQKETIAEIEVAGNQVLGEDVVLMRLKINKGDRYSPEKINSEIKRLYNSGYFSDVKVYTEEVPEGKKVVFEVQEKPRITNIDVQGAEEIDVDDIKEVMSTKKGSVLNPKVISNDLDKIRELYRKEGYYKASVSYSQKELGPGKAELIINVEEGNKLYIQQIEIEGTQKLEEDDIKDYLALQERRFWDFITGKGVLKEELLNRDTAAIEAYYANRGFMDAKVGKPEVEYKEDGIYITFQVVEGQRYKVGKVNFAGDLITEKKTLFAQIKMDELAAEDKFFNRSVLRDDSQALTTYYNNYGYAFAEAEIDLSRAQDGKKIGVTYRISKQQKVYIRQVKIKGNIKTRDNVIRRELAIVDGDLFNADKIARTKSRLQRLDFFEAVDLETTPTPEAGELDLTVKVKEKNTGMISAGAGYSSVNDFFVSGEISERNLMGRGYTLGFKGSFGGKMNRFKLHFWNPRLYDTKLGVGMEAYNTMHELDTYERTSFGGKALTSYSLGEYTKLSFSYELERYTIDHIEKDASDAIKSLRGDNWSSSVNIAAKRDSTNHRLYPTAGSRNELSLEYSGGILGGDDHFIKPSYEFSYFYKLFWKLVFNWHWKASWLFENTDEDVPDTERLYLGGIDTLRGYDYRDIHCLDDEGKKVGGYKSFYTNFEFIFPIKEDLGIYGVCFFDMGNVWNEHEDPFDQYEDPELDLYKDVGAGLRWNSPLGALRFEYGYPLDEDMGDGEFLFSMGRAF